MGRQAVSQKYGNLFVYERITGDNPYPRCRCAFDRPTTP